MSSATGQVDADALQASSSQAARKKPDLLALERETMGAPWLGRLDGAIHQTSFAKLKAYLAAEAKGGKKIFPPEKEIYTWSRYPRRGPGAVRVVLVGQDPYHGPGQAHGLSFSVAPGTPIPPSLRNIYKEIATEYPPKGQRAPSASPRPDLLEQQGFVAPSHGSLLGWAEQGVLLLNACLTVRAHQAGSHHGRGWEHLTRTVLEVLAEEAKHAQPAIGPTNTSPTSTTGVRAGKRSAPAGAGTIEQMFARAKRPKVAQGTPQAAAFSTAAASESGNAAATPNGPASTPGADVVAKSDSDVNPKSDADVASKAETDAAFKTEEATAFKPEYVAPKPADDAERDDDTIKSAETASEPEHAAHGPKETVQSSARPVLEPVQEAQDVQHGPSGAGRKSDADETGDVCRGIVFLAWGAQASKILADAGITDATPNTLILRSAHPSPLSAHRGFFNNGHFRKANEFLISRYGPEGAIDWGYLPALSH